jgi:hypothetical protein
LEVLDEYLDLGLGGQVGHRNIDGGVRVKGADGAGSTFCLQFGRPVDDDREAGAGKAGRCRQPDA